MQRSCACAAIIVLIVGLSILAGEEKRLPGSRDLRQAARQEFAKMMTQPPGGGEKPQFDRMARILDVLDREGIALAEIISGEDSQMIAARQGFNRVFAAARKTAADQAAAVPERAAAVRLLGRGPDRRNEDLKLLASLLIPQTPLRVQLAAVEAINRLPYEGTTEILLSGWTSHGPKVHTAVVSALLWRDPWMGALDRASESRPELAAALEWARRDISLRHPSVEIRSRAEKLRNVPPDKPEVRRALDAFMPVVKMQGDRSRGKKMFIEATCANCHKLEDVGRHVGPDLGSLADKSRRTLLVDTIAPNRVVDHRFLEYTLVTVNGKQLSGMLFDESDDSITIADANGESVVILRRDLDEMGCNHRSSMPEGLDAKLDLQQMADLIEFIANSSIVRDGQSPKADDSVPR